MLVAVDGGGDGMSQHLEWIVSAPSKLHDLLDIISGKERGHFFGEYDDVIGQKDGAKHSTGVAALLRGKATEVPYNLDPITWLCVCVCVYVCVCVCVCVTEMYKVMKRKKRYPCSENAVKEALIYQKLLLLCDYLYKETTSLSDPFASLWENTHRKLEHTTH
jgi:hypothetical protein